MNRHQHLWARIATFGVLVGAMSCAPDDTPEEAEERKAWALSMHQAPQPEKANGCFTVDFPSTEWREVPCVPAPNIPMVPRVSPFVIGGGGNNDVAAVAPSGTITQSIGRFENVVNVTSVTGLVGNSGMPVNDAYSLQVNTNPMVSTACAGSPNMGGCQGWEQFVFLNDGTAGSVFVQYWLLNFNGTCPANWQTFTFTVGQVGNHCWRNAGPGTGDATGTPNQVITNIGNFSLSGTATATGDSTIMNVGATMFMKTGDNSVSAATNWTIAEFNVFGAGGSTAGGGQANFNAGASMDVRTQIFHTGGTGAPTCVARSFTGETNNLNFGPTAPTATTPGPALIFQQSTAGGAAAACAASSAIGDTHLQTFNGLFYDFQAYGDFALVETTVAPGGGGGGGAGGGGGGGGAGGGPPPPAVPEAGGSTAQTRFVVQTRQVNGAPTWPDVSVNEAVATLMGETRVAICLPGRLVVNGMSTALADGGSLLLGGDSVKVSRTGNSYLIRSAGGDSVSAVVNATWIDVSVGLGLFPSNAKGLLVNANGNVNQIAARDGTVLTAPFAFDQLYGPYADSWRVPANASLLSVCSAGQPEAGIPTRPFYAADLPPRDYRRGLAACLGAGVSHKVKSLLDACILDVAVLGRDAAKVYVDAPAPAAVGLIVVRRKHHHHHHHHHHHGSQHDRDCDFDH